MTKGEGRLFQSCLLLVGLLGDLGGLVIADMGIESRHKHQRVLDISVDHFVVGLDSRDAMDREGVAGIGEEPNGVKEIVDDNRLEDIQLKVALGSGDPNGGIVAHDLDGDHRDRLGLRGVDLAGHDGGTGFVLREGEFPETATGAGSEPADVVGDLHERGRERLEGTAGENKFPV